MKCNTVFMYDTNTYNMYNYDIKCNVEFFYIITKYRNFPLVFLSSEECLKNWHTVWHVGTPS